MSAVAQTAAQLNFKEIKTACDVSVVLEHLELLHSMEERDTDLVGWCPLGTKRHGKKDSFSISTVIKVFQCFACKKKGTVLDFVAQFKGIHIRDSAALIDQITRCEVDTPSEPESAEEPETERSVMRLEEAIERFKNGTLERDPNEYLVFDVLTLYDET